MGAVEVGELVEVGVGEEDGADELVGHQAAKYLDPHGRPPALQAAAIAGRGGGRRRRDASLGGEAETVQTFEEDYWKPISSYPSCS